MTERDWWVLIDKKAAMREQFPSLAKVRNERPGCKADLERQRVFREAAQLARARQHVERWNAAIEENRQRQERSENRKRAAAYKAYQQERNERQAS